MVLRFGCGVFLAVWVAVSALSVAYLPAWAAAVVVAGFTLLAGFLFRGGMHRLVRTVFEAKGRTLRGAAVTAHEIEEVDRPVGMPDADQGPPVGYGHEPRYVLVDITVAPSSDAGSLAPWEPHELLLVPYHKQVSAGSSGAGQGDNSEGPRGSVRSAHLVAPDGTETEAPDQLNGEQRVRLVFACPARLRGRVKLQYYFESMGDLTLT
jgi:hypothetical protein